MTWGGQQGGSVAPSAPDSPVACADRRRSSNRFAAVAVGFVVIACFAAAVVVYFLRLLPPQVLTFGLVLAVVPLVIVLFGIRLVDRWEPEPAVALIFAFFWGAGVSVGAALLFDFALQSLQSALGGGHSSVDAVLGAVVQAPLVEEVAKGIGVLLVLWLFRKHFDGPVDGIVYAATVAAGFAFVENIQYFSVQAVDQAFGGASLGAVFLVRALMAPFGHIIYTSCIGFALGLAARRTGPIGAIGYAAVGLVPAVLLHALWNAALVVVGDTFLLYYVLVQVPIFLACVVLVIVLRVLERRVTRVRLAEYEAAGWFDAAEVALLSGSRSRARAQRWARHRGLGPEMKRFISDATRLASARQKILSGRRSAEAVASARADEADLLVAVAVDRARLRDPAGARAMVDVAAPPRPARSSTRRERRRARRTPFGDYDAIGAPAWPEADPDAVPRDESAPVTRRP